MNVKLLRDLSIGLGKFIFVPPATVILIYGIVKILGYLKIVP